MARSSLRKLIIIILTSPWDKAKLDSKIKAWKGETAGHTCYEDPIKDKCMRSLCYKRPFGIKSDS